VEADPERLRDVERPDHGLTHTGKRTLRALSLLQVLPAHEHMFAHREDEPGRRSSVI
jgi:hypothetical protein